jgi:hypothetical protein
VCDRHLAVDVLGPTHGLHQVEIRRAGACPLADAAS